MPLLFGDESHDDNDSEKASVQLAGEQKLTYFGGAFSR
jgi:hypothetical protein